MDIIDKYIGIWLTREEVEAIFGLTPASVARVFMMGGKVIGETTGIGLWVQLEFLSEGEPANNLLTDLPKEQPRRLVRWDFVRAAELFDEQPAMEAVAGFYPHAA